MSDHQRLLDRLRRHCLDKVGTTEEFPFDERTMVFKVGGKMFCLVDVMESRQTDPSVKVRVT